MKEFMNENRKPFYDLGEAEQKLILDVLYGRVVGYVVDRSGVYGTWFQAEGTSLLGDFIYRVVSRTTKPSINWDHVHPDYNYLAIDDGGAYLYEDEPTFEDGCRYWGSSTEYVDAKVFKSFSPGSCKPEDSLISRDGAAR